METVSEKDVQKALKKKLLYVGCNNFSPETTTEISISFSKAYDIHYANLHHMGYQNLQEAVEKNGGIANVVLLAIESAGPAFKQKFCELVASKAKENLYGKTEL